MPPPTGSRWARRRTSSAIGSSRRASISLPGRRRGPGCAGGAGPATATGPRRRRSSRRARGRPRSCSTSPSARSRRGSPSCGTVTTSSSAGASSGALIDKGPSRVIVFTNLLRRHETGRICPMLQHRCVWLGSFASAFVMLLLVPVLALAAAEGEHGGGGLISLDKSLIIQMLNFLILLAILYRLLYKPLLAKMEERSAAIKKSLDEAQAARAAAAKQQEETAERLRAAYAEAQSIRAAALKEAADEQRKLVEAARREAQQLVESARAQTEADIRRAREELRREVSEIAIAVAEKLVRKSLRDEEHRRIVDDAIARIGR